MATPGQRYKVAGFEVVFPHKAYGVQLSFMNQVIRAIDHQENALLEAPTGCGKTLSLLCGALAWQTAQQQKKTAAERHYKESKEESNATTGSPVKGKGDTADSDIAAPSKTIESDMGKPADGPEPISVPRIYYATRTHSQIAQVVKELKRTTYKPRMAVLGSRPHYCINKNVIRSGSVDAGCEELNKEGQGCRYKKNIHTMGHGLVQVHDIEDLVKIGTRHKACPYFSARTLADTAQLVFCPYSYLLDPSIRRATKVDPADAILIFDEAHNIEDQAREAGTAELDLDSLKHAYIALNVAAGISTEPDIYRPLADAVLAVIQWLIRLGAEGTSSFKSVGFERFEKIWTGNQMLSALSEAGLGPQDVEHLWCCYCKARAAEDKASFNTEGEAAMEPVPAGVTSPRAGGAALGTVSTLLTVLRLMYGTYSEASPLDEQQQQHLGQATQAPKKLVQMQGGKDFVADYRLAVQMWVPRNKDNRFRSHRDSRYNEAADDSHAAFAEACPGAAASNWAMALCLWCLNPAVVFKSLSEVARSVLLTSGTLSPLASFSSELGLSFHVQLEAPHVVNMQRQVVARVVSHGFDGQLLNATHKEADKLEYQDRLGTLTLAVAGIVPGGVLLFLPSYTLMDKLVQRWKVTNMWERLQELKEVLLEPRQAGQAFDTAIATYYEAVRAGRGGLFLAVCRGKASEGIDFADGNARCVMVVGIPFPNVMDSKVVLKKAYNNHSLAATRASGRIGNSRDGRWPPGTPAGGGVHNTSAQLLSGDEWYSQQAFRALNQAVGRCIRHRLDYGAILLVDERFRQPRNQTSLSKWVRSSIRTPAQTQDLLNDLRGFFEGLAAHPPDGGPAGPQYQLPAQQTAVSLEHQQAYCKPGCEAAASAYSKPGFEAAPSVLSKPGYEAADVAPAMAPAKEGYDSRALLNNKPDYNFKAAAAAEISNHAGLPVTHRRPNIPSGPWHPRQQQQQQRLEAHAKPLGAGQRFSGPMDAFITTVQNPKTQPQQQWQPPQVKQEHQPSLSPPQQHCLQQMKLEPQSRQWQQRVKQEAQSLIASMQRQRQQQAAGQTQQQWQQGQQQQSGSGMAQQTQWSTVHIQNKQQQQCLAPGANNLVPPMPEVVPQTPASTAANRNPSNSSSTSKCTPASAPSQADHLGLGPQYVAQTADNIPAQHQAPAGSCTWQYQPQIPLSCISVLMQYKGGTTAQQPQLQPQQQPPPGCQMPWPSQQEAPATQNPQAMEPLQQQLSCMKQQQMLGEQQGQQPDHQQQQQPAAAAVTKGLHTAAVAAAAAPPCSSGAAANQVKLQAGAAATAARAINVADSFNAIGVMAGVVSNNADTSTVSATQVAAFRTSHAEACTAAAATVAVQVVAGVTTAPEASASIVAVSAAAAAGQNAATNPGVCPEVPSNLPGQLGSASAVPKGQESSGSDSRSRPGPLHWDLPSEVLQGWVSGDLAAMTHQLQQQGVPQQGNQGCSLHQVACFGIMGSFELALELCQQQQGCADGCMSSFWYVWHSHKPAGLLVVVAAARQLPPDQYHALPELQVEWMKAMQKHGLLDNLQAMAAAYDQVLDQLPLLQQKMQQQQQHQEQHLGQHQHYKQPHQQQQWPAQQQLQQHTSIGVNAPSARVQHASHIAQLQQQPGQRQQQQQCWQQRQLQHQKQQPQHQVLQPNAQANQHAGSLLKPALQQQQQQCSSVTCARQAMQLSQSARLPKRAALRSSKSQLAAQKRAKQAAGAPATPQDALTAPKAATTAGAVSNRLAAVNQGSKDKVVAFACDDDDDFMSGAIR